MYIVILHCRELLSACLSSAAASASSPRAFKLCPPFVVLDTAYIDRCLILRGPTRMVDGTGWTAVAVLIVHLLESLATS